VELGINGWGKVQRDKHLAAQTYSLHFIRVQGGDKGWELSCLGYDLSSHQHTIVGAGYAPAGQRVWTMRLRSQLSDGDPCGFPGVHG